MSVRIERKETPAPIVKVKAGDATRFLTAEPYTRSVILYYERPGSVPGEVVAGDLGLSPDETDQFAAALMECAAQVRKQMAR